MSLAHLKARVGENNPNWKGGSATLRDRQRNSGLKYLYGITLEDYDVMYEAQQGKCLLCEESKPLCVDHNHETGQVRGLLCRRCNVLVWVLDNPDWLEKASEYVAS